MTSASLLLAAVIAAASASAQWTATILDGNAARGIDAGQIVGETAALTAILWTSPASSVDLHPVGANRSYAYATDGEQQVGEAFMPTGRAALWTGSAGSYVDLHPTAASRSVAKAVSGGVQGGYAILATVQRAALWTGTAASYADLHPPAATRSFIEGIHDGKQVGCAVIGGVFRAGMWSGTAGSFVDLHPDEASVSTAYGIHGDRQVGFATLVQDRACIWSGSKASFVNLHPAGTHYSIGYGTFRNEQVGFTTTDGLDSAAYWRSSAGTHVNLHDFLPPQFVDSWAYSVWRDFDSGKVYVAGRAYDGADSYAVLWEREPYVVLPSGYTILRGNAAGGNLQSLQHSDDNRLQVRAGIVLAASQAPIGIEVRGTAETGLFTDLKLRIENSATTGSAMLEIDAFDYVLNAYVRLLTAPCTATDFTYTFDRNDAHRFISPAGEMKCRFNYRLVAPALSYPWTARLDWVNWELTP